MCRSSSSAFKPVFSYFRSPAAFTMALPVDGTAVMERNDANAAFYGGKLLVEEMLKDEISHQAVSGKWTASVKVLHNTLKLSETSKNGDGAPTGPTSLSEEFPSFHDACTASPAAWVLNEARVALPPELAHCATAAPCTARSGGNINPARVCGPHPFVGVIRTTYQ